MHRPFATGYNTRLTALLRLTRWDEHVLFTLPTTLLGINMGLTHTTGSVLDIRALFVVAANVVAVAFAFMINDVEDAPDDARDPARGACNAVASGQITSHAAWGMTIAAAILAQALFALAGGRVLLIGASTVTLSFLYSWRPVRLKARPVLDVLSHILMLAALLFLAGYVVYAESLHNAWIVAAAVAMISAYGQLYNQLRDYNTDRLANLHNSASMLGPRCTALVMRGCLIAGAVLLIVSIGLGQLPSAFVGLVAVLSPLLLVLRSHTDMRGSPALDITARLQTGAMLITTLALLLWLGTQVVS